MMAAHEGYENQHHLIHVRGAGSADHMDTLLLKAVQEGREGDVCSLIEQRADVNRTFQQNKTLLMIAAEKGYDNITNTLLSAGADLDAQDENGKTSLMIAAEKGHENIVKATVRETNVNIRNTEERTALMFAAENGHDKIVDILLDTGAVVNAEAENEGETALTLVREELVLIRLMQSSHKLVQKTSSMNEEDVRAELSNAESVAGTDEVDLVSVIEKTCPHEKFSVEEIEELKRLLQRIPLYKTIREKLLEEEGYDTLKIKNPATREKIKRILRTIDQKVLSNILLKAERQETRNGVLGMVQFMIEEDGFVSRLARLIGYDENSRKLLLVLAEAGNVKTLFKLIMQRQLAAPEEKFGNNLLHVLAVNNNLKGFFQEVQMSETTCDWLKNCFKMDNMKPNTFLAVAVNTEQMTEDDILEVMKLMIDISDSESVSGLCKKEDNRGESLLHVAVKQSMVKLMSEILSITPKAHKIKNSDGFNALHLAVQQKNRPMVKCILQQKDFEINMRVGNGETPLHIAAQLFQTDILTDLIKRGGDLSLKDEEDGHTPLHDCLQQVYFEGGHNEAKFIAVWNTILEEAITWWHWKVTPVEQTNEPERELRLKAVYYLRSCIQNDYGLSVLQYAADRGLVMCVQAMLSAKNIFVVQKESKNATQNFEIDVTNLCPEYFVKTDILYSKTELNTLNSAMTQTKQNREETVQLNAQDNAAEDGTRSRNQMEIFERGSSALGDDTNNISQSKPSTSNHKEKDADYEIMSFLEALDQLTSSNIAGEILESIPMKKLCQLEWGVSQWFFIGWILVHVTLMVLVTNVITTSKSLQSAISNSIPLFASVELYAFATAIHGAIKFYRRVKFIMSTRQRKRSENIRWNKKIQRIILGLYSIFFHDDTYQFAFAIFTFVGLFNIWAPKIQYFLAFLVFGWFLLLVPLKIFTRIYKILSVTKYIAIHILLPWGAIYFVVTVGFASAIQLEFRQLENTSSVRCIDGEPELTWFVTSFQYALYELLVMTSNLDTNLKHIRSVACVFFEHDKLLESLATSLVTLYAVISTVILLNMLIAIMSNAVTYGQHDKGWRHYQINETLSMREMFKIFKIFTGERSVRMLDRWLRGTMCRDNDSGKGNRYGIRYDSNRWYLRLNARQVKKVRAKVWQYPLDENM